MSAHRWETRRAGGDPADAASYERVTSCADCGIELTDNNRNEACDAAKPPRSVLEAFGHTAECNVWVIQLPPPNGDEVRYRFDRDRPCTCGQPDVDETDAEEFTEELDALATKIVGIVMAHASPADVALGHDAYEEITDVLGEIRSRAHRDGGQAALRSLASATRKILTDESLATLIAALTAPEGT